MLNGNNEAYNIILEARGVSKTFPGVVALDNVSFKVHRARVNALIGENGAGKSTLMKIFSGVYQDYSGQIILDGQQVRFSNTRDARSSSIAIIYQELNLLPNLSIAENIFLGREPLTRLRFIDYTKMHQETTAILQELNLDLDPRTPVASLRVGQQQIIEIAKALSLKSKIVIMDEPTSAISDEEVAVLFRLIRQLTGQGVTIIYISHKMDELFQISDYITVLRDGRVIDSILIDQASQEQIIQKMVGRPLTELYPHDHRVSEEEALRVEDCTLAHPTLSKRCLVDHVGFHVNNGEVLGIFGLMGAGRTELLETIFGLHRGASGQLFIKGREVVIKSPLDAINAGIGFVPEDRKLRGLIMTMNVRDNINIASMKRTLKMGFINDSLQEKFAAEYIKKLKIKTSGLLQRVANLSGGNQQKVVLAKWLATNPAILLLDEPTRGIDINAKKEIYALIDELVREGMAIIVVSSELPEILGIADRILVLAEGQLKAEFSRSEATEEKIMKAAIP
ncbi:MAG TPA: sugar ABC transporter ATP-binding protein [bacterium]|nr:sugar ABC transporter ATP-binding protein [bacterium]HPN44146.1 sugar ABC transporter ATP-binding protein [bacterium]